MQINNTLSRFKLRNQSDLVLVLCVIGILLILFIPVPAALLDFLLILNFCFALLVLLLTFYVEKPLQFSTFPSLLLITTLFRLALNISATRLILSDADAGQVISAIGSYVVAGNYVIGIIVFLVLIIVQYVVVTSGAQRVAEVAARFTLDSMPGKQMAIDADLNAGLIDETQAKSRRQQIEKEGSFYGAMDGASKFVKGDAIAGIIIILINIIGGLAIGIAEKGMSWQEALHTYTLLTVGDGIVTQIPALIISTGTGIIVTRAASDQFLSKEISRQITAYPKTLLLIIFGLLLMLLVPGIPSIPVLAVLSLMVVMAYYAYKAHKKNQPTEPESTEKAQAENDVYDALTVHPIEVNLGKGLLVFGGEQDGALLERIVAFRKQYAVEAGFVIPKIRVKENKKLAEHRYELYFNGIKCGEGEIFPDAILAINPGQISDVLPGQQTKDPTYGLPATWIHDNERRRARLSGYTLAEPITVLVTHISELIRNHAAELLTRSETERLVNRLKSQEQGLIEELIPNVITFSDMQRILQNLLREKVSMRNLQQIMEVLVDAGKQIKDPDLLTEKVRRKLAPVICQALSNSSGELYVLTLDPTVEHSLAASLQNQNSAQGNLVLEPKFAEQMVQRLAQVVAKMMGENLMPVLLCSPELRRHIRQFTSRILPQLSVLSLAEIPNNINLKSYAMVSL